MEETIPKVPVLLRLPYMLSCADVKKKQRKGSVIWVAVKIIVPFWVPIIVRHLIFRVPKKGP